MEERKRDILRGGEKDRQKERHFSLHEKWREKGRGGGGEDGGCSLLPTHRLPPTCGVARLGEIELLAKELKGQSQGRGQEQMEIVLD